MRTVLAAIGMLAVGAALGVGGYAIADHGSSQLAPADPYGLPVVCRGLAPCWQAGRRVRPPATERPCVNGNANWATLEPGKYAGRPLGPVPVVFVCAGSE